MQTPHIRHLRHRQFVRTRHSERLLGFCAVQGARLGQTPEQLFDMLKTMTADQISGTPTPSTPPANTAVPTITGTPTSGSVLTATNGAWTGTAPITYTYQWNVAGSAVSGQTAKTYTVQAGDAGKAITVTVKATNAAGNASATSAPVTAS